MDDHRNFVSNRHPAARQVRPSNAVLRLAAALARDIRSNLDPLIMSKLHDAVLSPSPETSRKVIGALLADGIPAIDLADFYIPAIARELGDQWCSDELGFASVTIGTARLQSMLRALGPNWSDDNTNNKAAASVLLVVADEVYHTLGALVLGGQLRRKGLSVKLVLGGKPKEIAERVSRTQYQSVFISSSRGETLESLRLIVDAVKTAIQSPPPVVIGGTILEVETADAVTALTGADYATKNPDEAVRLCGLQSTLLPNARTKNGI